MKINWINVASKILKGKTASCFFAITHNCNAKCTICSMWKIEKEPFLDITKIKRAIDKLDEIGIIHMQLTGGEPLLYPKIDEIIKYAKSKGIITHIVTNGSLLNKKNIERLAKSGINGVGVSIDHFDERIINKERGIDDLFKKISEGIRILKEFGIDFQASVTITRKNFKNLEKLCEVLTSMGFEMICFCYPITSTNSSYKIGSKNRLIKFNKKEMLYILDTILSLKNKYRIFNSFFSLNNLKNYLKGNKVRYTCVAGYKMFYLDWNLILHRCIIKNENYGNIFSVTKSALGRKECNSCMIACYRDGSIYYHGLKSIGPLIELFSFMMK